MKGKNQCLHNSLWATAFNGSYGTGLTFWWNVHHNQTDSAQLEKFLSNYSNLNNFIKDIDFENVSFTANRYSENNIDLLEKGDMLEAVYLTCLQEPIALGWVHNASYYWYNFKEEILLSNCYSDSLASYINRLSIDTNFTNTDDICEYPLPLLNGAIQISNLWLNTYYRVQFYDTRTGQYDGNLDQVVLVDWDGNVTIYTPPLDDEHPDYAFIMTYNTLKSSLTNIEDTLKKSNMEIKGYFTLFPNPSAAGIYYIKSEYEESFDLSVYDLKGSNIYNTKADKGITLINISNSTPGLYYLTLSKQMQVQSFKIIKE